MTGKIIGKRIVPDVFEVYERDIGTSNIKFSVSKVNDGVDFEELEGFAHIDYESGRTDRARLKKTVEGIQVFFELSITREISQEEGRHRMQLSFESDDLSIVFKTCIFTFIVCESIDGNLAFENLAPSLVSELEEKMEQTLLECSNIKDETSQIASQITYDKDELNVIKAECNNLKEETQTLKKETVGICEETKEFYYDTIQNGCVTSINSKTGDVVLTANDIEGIEQPILEPLYIDGAMYDGKSEVEVYTDRNYIVISNETYDLHLENKTCVYIKNLRFLNLYSDKLLSLKGCNSEIYLQIRDEMEIWASPKFYFYGDNCHYGIIKPLAGNYHLRFYSIEKNTKIYVEVKKLESIQWDTTIKNGFPVTVNYSDDVKYVNLVGIYGNTAMEVVNGVETIAYPVRGVGEPVEDENGNTKYKIDITTQNANLLSFNFCYDAVDSYSVSYDATTGCFNFYGTAYMDYESCFYLDKPIEKGNTIYFNAFNISSGIITELTSGNVLEITLSSDTTDLLKIGIDYLGNPSSVEGYLNSMTLTEDVTRLKVRFLERTMGTQLDNVIGLTVSLNNPMQSFKKSQIKTVTLFLDEPLYKIDKYYDQLSIKSGNIVKNVGVVTIENKGELTPLNTNADAPAIKKYDKDFPAAISYNKSVWIHGKSFEDSNQSINVTSSYMEFKKDVFGSYQDFDESVFPLTIMYYARQSVIELDLCPIIKVFEGDTTFYVAGGENPSGGYTLNIKK